MRSAASHVTAVFLHLQKPAPWSVEVCVALTQALWRYSQFCHVYPKAMLNVS